MSTLDQLKFRLKVDVVGRAVLRAERHRTERKLRRMSNHPHLNPPVSTSAWLKELIQRHYLIGRYVQGVRPVAWVTSGAPIEFLKALGYFLIYPENHGAVCGIRRTAVQACVASEEAGYSRDLCSYARTDIGTLLTGETPVGRLPRPDLLVCCDNICQTVVAWYRVLEHHFKVPLVFIDTPFLYGEARPHDLRYVERQIDSAIEVAERVAGRSTSPKALERVMALSHETVDLWSKIIETARFRPAPFQAFDEFIHMAPVVEMRGDPVTVTYYRALLHELERRVARGEGALRGERRRLIWDNLPIWFRVRALSDLFAARGVAVVASTYTNAWGELREIIDPNRPMESMARCYLHVLLNRTSAYKLQVMRTMVRDYGADGVVLHSDRSCKPYSIGQLDQQRALSEDLHIPALLLDADHNDERAYSAEQAEGRLTAFLEVIGA